MFYSGVSFCPFSHVVFVYNNHFLMSQMNMAKKDLMKLGLNPGQMVSVVPDSVDCHAA